MSNFKTDTENGFRTIGNLYIHIQHVFWRYQILGGSRGPPNCQISKMHENVIMIQAKGVSIPNFNELRQWERAKKSGGNNAGKIQYQGEGEGVENFWIKIKTSY